MFVFLVDISLSLYQKASIALYWLCWSHLLSVRTLEQTSQIIYLQFAWSRPTPLPSSSVKRSILFVTLVMVSFQNVNIIAHRKLILGRLIVQKNLLSLHCSKDPGLFSTHTWRHDWWASYTSDLWSFWWQEPNWESSGSQILVLKY